MNKTVNCPICHKLTELDSSNVYRPFCSERCRLIDLGQWIEEAYTITDSSPADTDQSNTHKH